MSSSPCLVSIRILVLKVRNPGLETLQKVLLRHSLPEDDEYRVVTCKGAEYLRQIEHVEGEAYAAPHEFFGGQAVFADIMEFSAQIPKVELRLYNYEARDALRDALQAYRDGGDLDSLMQEAQDTVEFLMME